VDWSHRHAANHPDDLAGVVLADTFTPPILSRGEWLLRRVALPGLVGPVRLLGYERVERANAWVAERLAGGSSGDYGEVERLRETGPRMTTAEFAKVMRLLARFHEASVDLSAVTVPALALYGEHELPFVVRHAAELAARLPDVEVDAVPDAGHASNLDNPAYFTAAVRRFLERIHAGDETVGDGDGAA
jgi:pimeloyl-ACP methyl ester carboxylesterase